MMKRQRGMVQGVCDAPEMEGRKEGMRCEIVRELIQWSKSMG